MALASPQEVTVQKPQRLRTHILGFDEAIGGGIPRGFVVLFNGAPGTMKSSLVFNIAYRNALENGERVAYFTLEQNKGMLLAHMASLGMDRPEAFQNLMILDMGTVRKNLQFVQGKARWIELFKMYVQNFVRTEKCTVLVLDSLDVLESMAQLDDRRAQLYYLFEWLRELGLTSLIVSERPLPYVNALETPAEAYIADGIVHLSLHESNDVFVQRRIRCLKMRTTRHDPGYYALLFEDGRFEVTRAVTGSG
ncbi:MAG TPA: ATPase domain-containing protein [Thermoplasmata archaeon]|nr:ATPase domain-containing protein [Thermoplasmata archaeon]